MKKIILDLCGGTGAWSKPYRDYVHRGLQPYEVHVVTLPDYDVTKVNIDGKYITFLPQTLEAQPIRVRIAHVYGILCAPPCTEFSLAGADWRRPKWLQGLETVEACERIVRYCRATGYLHFWAMENPRGFLRQFLGRPKYTFHQWQFGEMYSKATDLWGYYNEPASLVTVKPDLALESHRHTAHHTNPTVPLEYQHLSLTRADLRAITPSGFALAFFKANK